MKKKQTNYMEAISDDSLKGIIVRHEDSDLNNLRIITLRQPVTHLSWCDKKIETHIRGNVHYYTCKCKLEKLQLDHAQGILEEEE